ncbi:MAG: hypothetical protein KKB30_10740 [Proteobacteria bacterium]|nr:hypothetical protein [Pseudomonadota bacterium]MBU1717188.1 hypothetical protein [Pseudomonadota bacterium]
MEEIVDQLRKIINFKKSTEEGDVVLIVMDNPQSLLYAVVTGIERDESRRDEWWHLSLQILAVPPQKVVWTLRVSQFTGEEIFTMGGDKRFIQAVDFSIQKSGPVDGPGGDKEVKPKLRVVK